MNLTPTGYRLLSMIALPLAGVYLLWRSRKQPAYREHWGERFGWYRYPEKTKPYRVWLHAVSVGETNAARSLLLAILDKWPDCDVLLTHMTPTGRETGKKLLALAPQRIRQCYLPYDAPFAIRKFLKDTNPTMGIIMETEVWPNVMAEATRQGIPMVLANARESDKSASQARKIIKVMRPAFASFTAVLAQSAEDKERLVSLGADNVSVCGSVKFDLVPNREQQEEARVWKKCIDRPICLIASSRQGEELVFAQALVKRKQQGVPNRALTLLVPRHPQRFDEVYKQLRALDLSVQKRTELTGPADIAVQTDVLLGDSMGEMSFYCALADVTIMGGSFGAYGCQNVIEPAMAGSPVVVGPSTFNFDKVVKDGIAEGVFVQVTTPDEALAQCESWLRDDDQRQKLSVAASTFAKDRMGATMRMMNIMEPIWKNTING